MTSGTGERQVALHGPHSDGHQIHIVNKEGYIMLFHTPSYMASRSMQPTPSGCWTVVNPWIEKQVIHVPVRLFPHLWATYKSGGVGQEFS